MDRKLESHQKSLRQFLNQKSDKDSDTQQLSPYGSNIENLKAASNKSFHGGSSRGGYGHGLAADIVSVQGGTRDERWASSDKLWKWVDANGKEFGIGRPYLGRDPPHVAPVDGREYAAHNRGTKQAASGLKKADMKKADMKKAEMKKVGVKKVKRVATRDHSRPAKRPRTAAALKLKAS